MTRITGYAASITLTAIGALHVAWGLGSAFPFGTRAELADAVVGARAVPSAAACGAVAGALFVAGGLVADIPIGPAPLRMVGRGTVTSVLVMRGVLGVLGRTDAVSPGSGSERFNSLDRHIFGPLCLLLAVGCATATTKR